MAYILKHWRGELSLAISFWINVFLINIGMRIFEVWLTESSPIENPVLASQVVITYVFVTLAIVFPWQIIGLWRAANRHAEETKNGILPGSVKGLAVLSVLATLGNLSISWSIYKDTYQIGFGKDEYGEYRVEVIDDGSLVHLTGGLGFGISKEVGRLVDNNPNIKGIILDSVGGRIYEGRELSKIILINGLDTYSLKGCYSACGSAFISGNKRYLAEGANLAFHQYNSGANSFDPYINIPSEQKKDLHIYERRGISQHFIDRIFATKQDDLWYPTVDEMINAGVIHEVVEPSTFKPIQYGSFNASELEEVLSNIPAFLILKKHEPQIYQQIIKEMEAKMRKGASILEIQQVVSGYIQLIASKALPRTSDKALISFVRETINILKILEEKEPIICMKNLFPGQYGPLEITKYLSKEQMTPMMDAMSLVIVDSYKTSDNTKIYTADAEELVARVVIELGDDAGYLETKGLQNREEYSRACNTVIRFYQLILSNNNKIAGNGLRYAFSP
ncbi:hypothetical protein [Nitrosomonas supralitoralis]|uniref:Uncharacterized protein n=1 Tax=Nitrosomonas supralitoralis TaxID=2116706 RepID=A0A2P7NRJ3_9PROT|nr:hypothetical protein [Nitrosomonas supralitoralis]PSJ16106.1 hypothetical protein C7H79_15330 [Nitrosomonas supralitoralis]